MSVPNQLMATLSGISGVLNLILLLVGLVMSAIAYFKWKNKIALLGMIGFLLMFLLSCCTLGWGLADRPVLRELPARTAQTYWIVRAVILFLLNLASLAGLALLIVAVWIGGKKGRDNPPQ